MTKREKSTERFGRWKTNVEPAGVLARLVQEGVIQEDRPPSFKTTWTYFSNYEVVFVIGKSVKDGFIREKEICLPMVQHGKKHKASEDFAHNAIERLYIEIEGTHGRHEKSSQVSIRKPLADGTHEEVVLSHFRWDIFEKHVETWSDMEQIMCHLGDVIRDVEIAEAFDSARDYCLRIKEACRDLHRKQMEKNGCHA